MEVKAMCRFVCFDVKLELRCPIRKSMHTVTFQASPWLRGHGLDVLACDGAPEDAKLTCGKACRSLVESGAYWQTIYPESARFA
jgi:hypothetical protein